jgi:hypothetical protein
MPKPHKEWTVLPHGPIEILEENLWYVWGRLDNVQRMMTIARLSDGRLVIYNAIALDEAEMKEIEAFGKPSFLIVPGAIHRMDARIYKERYPDLVVIAPEGAKKRVEKVVKVDRTECDFGESSVSLLAPECAKRRDAVMMVRSARGVTLVINDLVFNIPHFGGLRGLFLRLLGFTGPDPKVPPLPRLLLVEDRIGLRNTLEELAATPDLIRVIVSHGPIIDRAPARALRAAAATA